MKKTYSTPYTETIILNISTHILAGSDPDVGIDPNKSSEAGDVDSRRRGGWFDDEE